MRVETEKAGFKHVACQPAQAMRRQASRAIRQKQAQRRLGSPSGVRAQMVMPDQSERKHCTFVLQIGAGQSRNLLIASNHASARKNRRKRALQIHPGRQRCDLPPRKLARQHAAELFAETLACAAECLVSALRPVEVEKRQPAWFSSKSLNRAVKHTDCLPLNRED